MHPHPKQIQGIRPITRQLAGERVGIRASDSRVDHRACGSNLERTLTLPVPVANPAPLVPQVSARTSRLMEGRKVDIVLAAPSLCRLPIHQVAIRAGQPL
jgi:hypothetical protein